jgi:hypothetical protein
MAVYALDVNGHEYGGEELPYCSECDKCAEFEPVTNDLFDRWRCTNCGYLHVETTISDYGFQLQGYLLQASEYDEGLIQMYDGTWK